MGSCSASCCCCRTRGAKNKTKKQKTDQTGGETAVCVHFLFPIFYSTLPRKIPTGFALPFLGPEGGTRADLTRGCKKGIGVLRGGWVGGSKAKKGRGSFFLGVFVLVFSTSPRRETPKKRDKQNRGNISFWDFFVDCFVKTFRHDFLQKAFCSTFEGLLLRNT
jgi:hypothetical protein